jgi:hypothetical protein
MWSYKKSKHGAAPDQSALDALLEAERTIAAGLHDAEREADRLVQEARAAVEAADEQAERELAEQLELLDVQAAAQRAQDTRTVEAEAARRAHLFADANADRISAIAERLALLVAPVANGP